MIWNKYNYFCINLRFIKLNQISAQCVPLLKINPLAYSLCCQCALWDFLLRLKWTLCLSLTAGLLLFIIPHGSFQTWLVFSIYFYWILNGSSLQSFFSVTCVVFSFLVPVLFLNFFYYVILDSLSLQFWNFPRLLLIFSLISYPASFFYVFS